MLTWALIFLVIALIAGFFLDLGELPPQQLILQKFYSLSLLLFSWYC